MILLLTVGGMLLLLMAVGGVVLVILHDREGTRLEGKLRAIGRAYHTHLNQTGRPPARAEDLQPFLSPEEFTLLKDGSIVFIYNAGLGDMPGGVQDTILAYERDVPLRGGRVLFADGSVETISDDEFDDLPKAQPRH